MVLLLPLLARNRHTGALLHPLLIGAVSGGLAGDLSMGWMTGIAVSPWSEALSRGRPSVSAAIGAAIGAAAGVLLAGQGLVGGFLVEAFAGGVVGITLAVLLSPIEERVASPSRLHAAIALGVTLLAFAAAFGVLRAWPEGVRAAAPSLSGAAMVVGLGALCGRRNPQPGAEARTAGGLGLLLLGNFVGPAGLVALPALYPLERIQGGRWIARGVTVALAIAIAFVMAWFPYQLPSQELPLIPGTKDVIGPMSAYLLMPLVFIAGVGGALTVILAASGKKPPRVDDWRLEVR